MWLEAKIRAVNVLLTNKTTREEHTHTHTHTTTRAHTQTHTHTQNRRKHLFFLFFLGRKYRSEKTHTHIRVHVTNTHTNTHTHANTQRTHTHIHKTTDTFSITVSQTCFSHSNKQKRSHARSMRLFWGKCTISATTGLLRRRFFEGVSLAVTIILSAKRAMTILYWVFGAFSCSHGNSGQRKRISWTSWALYSTVLYMYSTGRGGIKYSCLTANTHLISTSSADVRKEFLSVFHVFVCHTNLCCATFCSFLWKFVKFWHCKNSGFVTFLTVERSERLRVSE